MSPRLCRGLLSKGHQPPPPIRINTMHNGDNSIAAGLFHFGGPHVGRDNNSGAARDMEGADPSDYIEAGSPAIRAIFAAEEADVAETSSLTS